MSCGRVPRTSRPRVTRSTAGRALGRTSGASAWWRRKGHYRFVKIKAHGRFCYLTRYCVATGKPRVQLCTGVVPRFASQRSRIKIQESNTFKEKKADSVSLDCILSGHAPLLSALWTRVARSAHRSETRQLAAARGALAGARRGRARAAAGVARVNARAGVGWRVRWREHPETCLLRRISSTVWKDVVRRQFKRVPDRQQRVHSKSCERRRTQAARAG